MSENPLQELIDGHDLGAEAKPDADRTKYPCERCGGTGAWSGGVNRYGNAKCRACDGRGYFFTTKADRYRKRAQAAASKASRLKTAQAAFAESEPDLIEPLRGMVEWNDFAASLVAQFDARGDLSEKQVASARRMIAKCAASRAERTAKRDAASVTVDLSAIRAMFDTAFASGRKRPSYRAEGLALSRAPDHGRNAGAIYVKIPRTAPAGDPLNPQLDDDSAYQGKITPDNVFAPSFKVADTTVAALQAIAADPTEAAVRYGRKTGNCACCGRELTNAESVALGIGPICAGKFGL